MFRSLIRFVARLRPSGLITAPVTFTFALLAASHLSPLAAQTQLLNVSYDPTRELYQQINKAFIADWTAKSGQKLTIN
jgi:ABC-type sulfate transport system substrate-binding protein